MLREELRRARTGDREPPHGHAVDRLDAGAQLVLPGHVVAGAGRQHLDLGMPRQVLGHVPRVQLRSAVDLSAIALNDDSYPHYSASWGPAASCSPPPRSSWVAARCSSLVV